MDDIFLYLDVIFIYSGWHLSPPPILGITKMGKFHKIESIEELVKFKNKINFQP
jgi:hypothetical protein